jgi:hypothetical protein
MFVGNLGGMAGQHPEFHRQQLEQFRAAGRSRSQNERRQFHNPILAQLAILSSVRN